MTMNTGIRIATFAGCALGALECLMSEDWTELSWIALTAWWMFDATRLRQALAKQTK